MSAVCLLVLLTPSGAAGDEGPVYGPTSAPHIEVELVARDVAVRPGSESQIGLRVRTQPHWHIYWGVNVGDSGMEPLLEFETPEGVEVSGIRWPAPERFVLAGLVNYVYEGEIVLPMTLKVAPDFSGDVVDLKADVAWLVCEESCVDGAATLGLRLRVEPSESAMPLGDARWAALFARAEANQPQSIDPDKVKIELLGEDWVLHLEPGPWAAEGKRAPHVEFAAGTPEQIDGTQKAQATAREDGGLRIDLGVHKKLRGNPERLRLVLRTGQFPTERSWWIDAPVSRIDREPVRGRRSTARRGQGSARGEGR